MSNVVFSVQGERTTVQCNCPQCGSTKYFQLPTERIQRWQGGEYIQDVFPELDADQREHLQSGICKSCWDELFDMKGLDDV